MKPASAVLLVVFVLLPGALFGGQLPDRARTDTLAARAAERLHSLHDEADRLATEERTLRAFRNDLDWPVPGSVRQRFGAGTGSRRGMSNGIEIAATEGTRALAIHDGTVAFADTFAGYGNQVILDHGAQAFSLYGNLLDIAVARGTRVERGQPVGSVGVALTGSAGLYFELRVDGRAVDPLQWLKKR